MSRADLVEKAARAAYKFMASQVDYDMPKWDSKDAADTEQGWYRAEATAVLDAILPTVSTVEELEALPVGAVVMDAYGEAYTRTETGLFVSCNGAGFVGWDWALDLAERVRDDDLVPLTVVWMPDVQP